MYNLSSFVSFTDVGIRDPQNLPKMSKSTVLDSMLHDCNRMTVKHPSTFTVVLAGSIRMFSALHIFVYLKIQLLFLVRS